MPRLRLPICASRDDRGATAIEFAFVAPLLVMLLIACVEIGFAARAYLLATDAASNAANYAAHNGWNVTAISAVVANSTTSRTITASPQPITFCGCPGTASVETQTCGVTCSDGMTTRRYATVYASVSRPSIFSGATNIPTLVTASATAQLQ